MRLPGKVCEKPKCFTIKHLFSINLSVKHHVWFYFILVKAFGQIYLDIQGCTSKNIKTIRKLIEIYTVSKVSVDNCWTVWVVKETFTSPVYSNCSTLKTVWVVRFRILKFWHSKDINQRRQLILFELCPGSIAQTK